MLSTISNINLMRKQATIVSAGAVWMIGDSTAAGNISVSNDNGTTWNTYITGLASVKGIAYGLTSTNTQLWVATGNLSGIGRIATSSNSGSSWTLIDSNVVSMTSIILTSAYGQNQFMVGGYSTTGSNIFSSSDGTTWAGVATINTINYVSEITYGKLSNDTGIWVAVGISTGGGAGVAISTTGSSWTKVSNGPLITNSVRFMSISFGIDNAGNKRWVAAAEMSINSPACIYTLINPTNSDSFATWTAIASDYMRGRAYSVAFGRGVSGNTFVIAGAVGSGSGNTIVTYDGATATGYIPPSATIYQGLQVGYLNTGSADSSRFYLTFFPSTPNQIGISQYANSWTTFLTRTYTATPNESNGYIVSSIPY